MINKVILVGNVGGDPEVRTFNGQKIAKFSIATTERFKDKDGELRENTEWHNISAWSGLAEIVEKYVVKGSQVYLEGKIKTTSYDKNGEKRYSTGIDANTIKLLGRKESASQPQSPAQDW